MEATTRLRQALQPLGVVRGRSRVTLRNLPHRV